MYQTTYLPRARFAPLSLALLALLSMPAWGQSAKEIVLSSSLDGSTQAALFYAPGGEKAVPLIVALHTWSGDYRQEAHQAVEQWCMEQGWAYLHPDFRGPNQRPEATGSPLAIQDVLDAVNHVQQLANIDASSTYLVGTSGGGYMALLLAGRHPDVWAGVSAWVPIVDLAAWYEECTNAHLKYAKDVEASCGGAPGVSPAADREYRERSPLTWLERAKGLPVHVNVGMRDGHEGSVPVSHSLRAFNALAQETDRIADEDIRFFTEQSQTPEHLKAGQPPLREPAYGEKQPLFRRQSGNAVLTVFDGAHDFIPEAALAWIKTLHDAQSAVRERP